MENEVKYKNGVRLINMCVHDIKLMNEDGSITIIPPSGSMVRCRRRKNVLHYVNGIPITKGTVIEIQGLPAKQPNTLYIVSKLVLDNVKDRDDFVRPEGKIKDMYGHDIACTALSVN